MKAEILCLIVSNFNFQFSIQLLYSVLLNLDLCCHLHFVIMGQLTTKRERSDTVADQTSVWKAKHDWHQSLTKCLDVCIVNPCKASEIIFWTAKCPDQPLTTARILRYNTKTGQCVVDNNLVIKNIYNLTVEANNLNTNQYRFESTLIYFNTMIKYPFFVMTWLWC